MQRETEAGRPVGLVEPMVGPDGIRTTMDEMRWNALEARAFNEAERRGMNPQIAVMRLRNEAMKSQAKIEADKYMRDEFGMTPSKE